LRIQTLTYERCPLGLTGINIAAMRRLSDEPDVHPLLPVEVRDAELRRITHDLGNLLVTIVGSSYALRVGLPTSSARRDAADIESAGQRAGVLVAQLAASLADGPSALPEEWEAD
jgi:hypothetical protein